jgi:N6-L-threonylcarbamoyladenine synthase
MSKYILGIETSCDETSMAIVDGIKLMAHVTASQIQQHQVFGGVFPELASRLHTEHISLIFQQTLKQAQLKPRDLAAVAVTRGPGLIGALHIGLQAAKTIAAYHHIPLIAVHHHAAHLEAIRFIEPIQYPAVGLIVSGGHTQLVYMPKPFVYELLGQTQDDAVGESYDKVARMLNLGYPGGPIVDQLAQAGQPRYLLPTPKTTQPFDFSFSGLKTAVSQLIRQQTQLGVTIETKDLAYAFQKVIIDTLVEKTIFAAKVKQVKHIVVGGGVSLNQSLRQQLKLVGELAGFAIQFPPAWACTDNGAMIALLGSSLFLNHRLAGLEIGVNPNWSLIDFSQNKL